MIERTTLLTQDDMFRGKDLPSFVYGWRHEYRYLIGVYGHEKYMKVYNWLFSFMSKLQWGQWMVLQKICPNPDDRPLLLFCMEFIYQSDMFSQYRFEQHGEETWIVVVEPSKETQQSLGSFFPGRRYNLIDWYNRLLHNPYADDDIDPSWLCLPDGETEIDVPVKIETGLTDEPEIE